MICGIIVAAGLSSRMGSFKPLMQLEGKALIENSIDSMLDGGVSTVVVVLGYRALEVASELHAHYPKSKVIITYNTEYATTQMLDSVKIGIELLPECEAFYLLPGDMPAVDADTFTSLREEMAKSGALIVFPTIGGHRKHPPLISFKCLPKIRNYSGEGGLREVWKQFDTQIAQLPVDDIGCQLDADTMDNYQCLVDYVRSKKEKCMNISHSVTKKDHLPKMNGEAVYVADYPSDGVLCGKLLHSSRARARIVNVRIPILPEEYLIVDKKSVPGINLVHIVMDDTPVYADETVEYIGDPILMVVGPKESEVDRILSGIQVEYEDLPPVFDVRDPEATTFFDYNYGKGDVEDAFAKADKVYIEEFRTGRQEQAYLEPQGMMAEAHDGRITVHGSMQCPYYIHGAVAKAMGYEPGRVQIKQDVTGGGFGGKEAYPSILACQVAVAAYAANKPVRVIFDRREDMEFTSKRHPSLCTYKVSVKDGHVTAMDIDVIFDGGAYTTLSAVVLQRGIICANGIYKVENLKVHGRAVKTNTVPSGAYRGFGAPQTFFAVEMIMDHIAKDLKVEALAFKQAHLVKQGDETSTGGRYHFPVPIPEMIEEVEKESNFREKKKLYQEQSGRYRRGIGMSMVFHGAGFTGSGERDFIKAVAKLHKYPDGTVEILASNSDIGQGLKTTFSKIVAQELNLPLEKVIIHNPDTDRVPDSGPTVASRSLMTVGELLRRASIKLLAQWVDGEDQIVEEHFVEPDFVVPFYLDRFHGDAYPTYAWSVNAIEVEVDTLTGLSKVLGAWGSFDVGTPIDMNIVVGQMEGGFLQGIGYSSIEQIDADSKGRIRNNSLSDYILPTSMDVPNLKVIIHVEKYPLGPYGAKGAGEIPLVGAPGAYLEAMEQALKVNLNHIPFSAEDTMKVLHREAQK